MQCAVAGQRPGRRREGQAAEEGRPRADAGTAREAGEEGGTGPEEARAACAAGWRPCPDGAWRGEEDTGMAAGWDAPGTAREEEVAQWSTQTAAGAVAADAEGRGTLEEMCESSEEKRKEADGTDAG